MAYSRIRENTASLWMTKTTIGAQSPGDGQGSVVASIANSLCASASVDNPVIIDAVVFDYNTSTSPADTASLRIRDESNNDLLVVTANPTTSQQSQYFKVGGPFGVRINVPFKARIGNSGTNALPYTQGSQTIGPVTIFFRYA